jgi:hypothetical protein
MAGTLIVSNITTDTDNTFIVRSNTGTTLFSANTTGIDTANSLPNTGVTAGTYGGSSNISVVTVNAKGLVTSASNTAINLNSVTGDLTVSGNTTINGTGFLKIPNGTTAQRPSSNTSGSIRWNTSNNVIEVYTGNVWASVATSGALVRAPQVLTSGTSYTTPANCNSIYVECVGGGGAGGGSQGAQASVGGGGGGGAGYSAKFFTVTPNTAYTYAIAAGGTGVTSGASNNGGDTTFTVGSTILRASGGGAGSSYGVGPQGNGGGSGGGSANGDINLSGDGGEAVSYNYNWIAGQGGGGAGAIGGGGAMGIYYAGAINGGNYGGGGSGAANGGTSGAGGQGAIRIWEYT